MKHLLFVYPHNIRNTQDLAEEICDVLLGFSNSKNIKYTYGPKYIVIHFSTDPSELSELEDVLFIYGKQVDIDFTYFIVKANDGFMTNISPEIKEYLSDIQNDEKSLQEYKSLVGEFFLEELGGFTNIVNTMESKLSVDEILDKISQYGMESLTKQELNKLNNQSKNDNKI
jgi:hypothetical protein